MVEGIDMRTLIAKLTGHDSSAPRCFLDDLDQNDFWARHKIGVSQLNEILLAFAYETVTSDFFDRFFSAGKAAAEGVTREKFELGIEGFQKVALLKYGNIKFGFKALCQMRTNELEQELEDLNPIDETLFNQRPQPLRSVAPIDPSETYFLGHVTGEAIEKGHDEDRKTRLKQVREVGRNNLHVYLCSDEMDVYVATSMRDIEDFYFVGTVTKRLFEKPELADLKLRYFDPTQSFCEDRIEKGLVESLMLRRAKCTVYCAQTTETLGKDSELAVTLAQGKPVIVYVPQIKDNESRYRDLCQEVARIHSVIHACSEEDYYRSKLVERHAKSLIGKGEAMKEWGHSRLQDELVKLDAEQFERKASLLKEKHPLGIQVNLDTGVANGVLVVRTLTECAHVMRQIVTNRLALRIERDQNGTLRLVEERTNCTYRIMVSDPVLTNSFWNFYRPWISERRSRS